MAFISMVVLWVLLAILFNGVKSNVNNAQETMSKNVGVKVVLDGDTLTIIDYTLIGNTYTLSNTAKVSAEFVEKYRVE